METMAMRFTVSSDVRSDTDNDGTAILQIRQDKIYTIVGVGSAIWSKLVSSAGGLAPQQIVDALSADFKDIPHNQIERDVTRFLSVFQQKGFIHSEQERSKFRDGSRRFAGSTSMFLARAATGLLLRLRLRVFAAFCGLATIDFLIKFVSFDALYGFIKHWPVSMQKLDQPSIDQINDAVTRALTWYPKHAMCLQRSAVTTILLRSSGIPAQMIIGCQKLPFLVHAWVEVGQEVVNDSSRVQEIHKVLDRC
jgi:transglutaminase superfamily protein/coenzyme PQQ synthesis protein D (PqqD)